MNRKHLVLPLVLVVAAACVAAVQLWPSRMKDMRASRLCLGMLTERTAGLLYDGKGGGLTADEYNASRSGAKSSDPVFRTICFVNRHDEKGTSDRTQYTLDVRPIEAPDDPAKDATPVGGGLSGWIGPRQSEVLLPDSCTGPMRTAAPHVRVTLKVAPGVVAREDWDTAALIAKSRTVIMEGVDSLTEQYDCRT